MQTLLDPYELATGPSRSPAPSSGPRQRAAMPVPPAKSASSQPWIDVELDVEDAPVPSRPGSDSSGRLRVWGSED